MAEVVDGEGTGNLVSGEVSRAGISWSIKSRCEASAQRIIPPPQPARSESLDRDRYNACGRRICRLLLLVHRVASLETLSRSNRPFFPALVRVKNSRFVSVALPSGIVCADRPSPPPPWVLFA